MVDAQRHGHAGAAVRRQFEGDVPLVALTRDTDIGSVHRGIIALRDAHGQPILDVGDTSEFAYLRSAAKPFQALPAVLGGAVERFDLTEPEVALLCASHNGEEQHVTLLASILNKLGLPPDALQCGVHPPMHAPTASARIAAGLEPTVFCHNCSGSHAGMLAACLVYGWPLTTYTRADHPLQRMIRELIAKCGGVSVEAVRVATDNCNVPTFGPPLRAMAVAFARLASGQELESDLATAALRIASAMAHHPYVVAGEGRFDTALMLAGNGELVAKGGAEGYQGVGARTRAIGLALKISDGATRAVAPATVEALLRTGILSAPQAGALDSFRRLETLDHNGTVIGRAEPLFD